MAGFDQDGFILCGHGLVGFWLGRFTFSEEGPEFPLPIPAIFPAAPPCFPEGEGLHGWYVSFLKGKEQVASEKLQVASEKTANSKTSL
ncbi:MAG: hypothetical protein ONB46_08440 [candidate division KSB1 bacterium]|nr:hypothetical protein [candidate division KSB1 bacterium]MDZ7365949.1 hypothetical protein [candidate division KSB1 bacterium]